MSTDRPVVDLRELEALMSVALAKVRREAAAEALEQAAEDLRQAYEVSGIDDTAADWQWLRDRAAAIREGES